MAWTTRAATSSRTRDGRAAGVLLSPSPLSPPLPPPLGLGRVFDAKAPVSQALRAVFSRNPCWREGHQSSNCVRILRGGVRTLEAWPGGGRDGTGPWLTARRGALRRPLPNRPRHRALAPCVPRWTPRARVVPRTLRVRESRLCRPPSRRAPSSRSRGRACRQGGARQSPSSRATSSAQARASAMAVTTRLEPLRASPAT